MKPMCAAEAMSRCWLEIDLDAVESNYRTARRLCAEKSQIIPVLKANGYGLGASVLSQALYKAGAGLFAVADLYEALEVKSACGGDVLVLGMIGPLQMRSAVEQGIVCTVYSAESARQLNEAAAGCGRSARVHIKVDTGLHRLGFDSEDIRGIRQVFALENLCVEGLYTHLALRDQEGDAAQIAQLKSVTGALRSLGLDFGMLHVCDSIGMVRHPQWHYDGVRVGAWLYGVVPNRYPNIQGECRLPVRLMARIAQIRRLAKGEYVGYDEDHPLPEDRVIATISAGYADGYPRVNSVGEVGIRGHRAPIAGLICMDQMMADITDIPDVSPGDAVELMGGVIPLEDLSRWTGNHRNEILSRIGRRVPRIYLRKGTPVEVSWTQTDGHNKLI